MAELVTRRGPARNPYPYKALNSRRWPEPQGRELDLLAERLYRNLTSATWVRMSI
ncbi:hypothetical protein [Skermania sp. ID1734]|uniref:hypothetical protein n=1 Tax=Skermania sp. ID1734 TaxID=2597516 RepID=UPI00163DA6B8|nr:hypothetical protein [Skermania sp. ID1734]